MDKPVIDRFNEVARDRGLPPWQIALAWVLHNPASQGIGTDPGNSGPREFRIGTAVRSNTVYGSQTRLAPLYDVLSTAYYPDLSKKMAMKIGGEYASEKVGPKNFDQLANEAGLAKPMVKRRVQEVAETVLSKMPELITGQHKFACEHHAIAHFEASGHWWTPFFRFRPRSAENRMDSRGPLSSVFVFVCRSLCVLQPFRKERTSRA
jgi:hypothetical protein